MTTQVPYGPENPVAPQEYPQFVTGYAQYPPAQDHYAPAAPSYPAVSYPQEGAHGYPAPTAYPQLTVPAQAGGPPSDGMRPQPGGIQLPPPAYPTAPPWAVPPQAAPAVETPSPPSMPGHGGLLVQFPDEMHNASRAQAPAVWPVALFTLFFSVLGAISAKRRADQARRGRNSTAPYWLTFLGTLAAAGFAWFVLALVIVAPFVDNVREGNRLEAVQRNVVSDGQLKNARIAATSAQCRAITDRTPEGKRDYLCRLTLDDGHTASLTLTADEDGNWKTRPAG